MSTGETDLDEMLADLGVRRRSGVFTYVFVPARTSDLAHLAEATVREGQGIALVVSVQAARAAGLPVGVQLAWLSLTVHSSLEAVGLTAAVSTRLAAHGIACNVLAGYRHDHLLVPVDQAQAAIALLTRSWAG
jgi:hypothetical protein